MYCRPLTIKDYKEFYTLSYKSLIERKDVGIDFDKVNFNNIVNDVTECFYNQSTDIYELPDSFDTLLYWHGNTEDIVASDFPGLAQISFDIVGYNSQCHVPDLVVDKETLNQLSHFLSFKNVRPLVDVDDAREILDTTIFDLLPKSDLYANSFDPLVSFIFFLRSYFVSLLIPFTNSIFFCYQLV